MKFSEIEQQQWTELQPYLDTCLLPITGLSGQEQPWEATQALESLRDALDLIEIPYKGRVVTYPAIHYVDGPGAEAEAQRVCANLKAAGFAYVIVMTIQPAVARWELESADLLLCVAPGDGENQPGEAKAQIQGQVQQMWHPQGRFHT